MTEKSVASHKVIQVAGGNRYKFYCDLSGGLVLTTKPYQADTPEEEVQLAWKSEGQKFFNQCHKCGKWVMDAMYNVDVLECVECAPFEAEAKFCKICGTKIHNPAKACPQCGNSLVYYGKELRG